MRKETLKSLSEKTGYSISTISRVLSGKGQLNRISKSTIDTIFQKAKEMNYFPNFCAQSLRTNKKNTIGLLIPSISNNFFSKVANHIINAAQQANYQVIIIDTQEDEEIEKRAIESMIQHNVDGLIIAPSGHNIQAVKELHKKMPIIFVDRFIKDVDIPTVSVDNYKGAYILTELLIRHGHSHIWAIQGKESSSANKERVRGFKDAMAAHNFSQFAHIRGNEFSSTNGYTETNIALLHEDKPTAIFTFSNNIFLGCMKALQTNKVSIPSQISVVTFDDDPYMDVLSPTITRIMQPVKEECHLAFKILLQAIEQQNTIQSTILLAPILIMRDSISFIDNNI